MQKMMVAVVFVLSVVIGKAQTFSEWFKQAKTQKKYLLQQIASYKIYGDYISKGYGIVKKGNDFIGKVKSGDLQQHKDNIQSLYAVPNSIRSSKKVAAILWMGEQIIPLAQRSIHQANTTALLSALESSYIQSVFQNLLQHCYGVLNELSILITPGKLQLTDDERLDRINRIYADMQVKYTFTVSFSNESGIFKLQRSKEKASLDRMQQLHGLP